MALPAGRERENIVEKIGVAQSALRNATSNIKQNMFNFLDAISILLTAYYKSGGLSGWTQGIQFSDGQGISAEDGKYIEDIFAQNERFLKILKGDRDEEEAESAQTGGALPLRLKKKPFLGGDEGIISADFPTDFDFSLDRGLQKVAEYNTMIDNQVREITDQIGPTAFISSLPTDPFIPNPLFPTFGIPPPKFQVPKYSILPFLSAILETLRLTTVFMPFDIPAFRKIMSISQAIFELSNGNWRQAIMSFIGYFGQNIGRISSVAKIIMQAWMMIDPSISSKLALYTYKGLKSLFITFWLWIFHVVSPDLVWIPIGRFLESVNGMIDSSQQSVDKLSETFTRQLQAMGYDGYTVRLPTVEQMVGLPESGGAPLRFSFDDLQNIQTLITMPFFLCSKEGQSIIQQFIKTPLRLVLELLNIPTLPEDIAAQCGQSDPGKMKSLAASLADNVVKGTQIVPPSGEAPPPGQAGGRARARTHKKRTKAHKKKTRRA
jgi:hypothetical protein